MDTHTHEPGSRRASLHLILEGASTRAAPHRLRLLNTRMISGAVSMSLPARQRLLSPRRQHPRRPSSPPSARSCPPLLAPIRSGLSWQSGPYPKWPLLAKWPLSVVASPGKVAISEVASPGKVAPIRSGLSWQSGPYPQWPLLAKWPLSEVAPPGKVAPIRSGLSWQSGHIRSGLSWQSGHYPKWPLSQVASPGPYPRRSAGIPFVCFPSIPSAPMRRASCASPVSVAMRR